MKTFLNCTMPALVNISVGSLRGTSGDDGTISWPFSAKKSRNFDLISLTPLMFIQSEELGPSAVKPQIRPYLAGGTLLDKASLHCPETVQADHGLAVQRNGRRNPVDKPRPALTGLAGPWSFSLSVSQRPRRERSAAASRRRRSNLPRKLSGKQDRRGVTNIWKEGAGRRFGPEASADGIILSGTATDGAFLLGFIERSPGTLRALNAGARRILT